MAELDVTNSGRPVSKYLPPFNNGGYLDDPQQLGGYLSGTTAVVSAASIRYGTVTGAVAVAGTAVNTGAVTAGITPVLYFVLSGPEGAAIASYSGGAGGTFSVNAAATGTVTVAYIY